MSIHHLYKPKHDGEILILFNRGYSASKIHETLIAKYGEGAVSYPTVNRRVRALRDKVAKGEMVSSNNTERTAEQQRELEEILAAHKEIVARLRGLM